ncbi:MAG: glycosyltransferase family 39 protein [Cyanobacteria bacterium J06621_8]
MSFHRRSIWRGSSNRLRQNEAWQECLYIAGLILAVSMLFFVNLTDLPLLDPQEGTLALAAKAIYQGMASNDAFLAKEDYLVHSPLPYNLIALAYNFAGVDELTTRLPGALLGGASVIILYGIGREIFVARIPAMFSALVYLTCLPVVRYSRLASLNGPLLCFELLTIWAALRSRRNLQWALVTGMGFSLMSLTQSLFAWQILLIVLLFLRWDTPRLLNSAYFWVGLIMGALPCLAWYSVLLVDYWQSGNSSNFISTLLLPTSMAVNQPELTFNLYLLHFMPYFFPWLFVMFAGLQSIKHNLHWGWGKLLGVWLGGYFIFGLLTLPQNYWLILPLFPPLALTAGRQLEQIRNLPSNVNYPQAWIYGFALMSFVVALAGINWGIRQYFDFYLPLICGFLSITFGVTALIIAQQDRQFITLLFWGLFVSTLLLIISPHWLWELRVNEPVKPIAELIIEHTEPKSIIYSSMTRKRPSLDFYSDRQIINQSVIQLKEHWQEDTKAYLLVDLETKNQLKIPPQAILDEESLDSLGWVLAIKN